MTALRLSLILVLLLAVPGVADIMPKCPKCGSTTVFVGMSSTTDMYSQPFYKDGILHNHNPNIITTSYTCDRGHGWEENKSGRCWCGWPENERDSTRLVHPLDLVPNEKDSSLAPDIGPPVALMPGLVLTDSVMARLDSLSVAVRRLEREVYRFRLRLEEKESRRSTTHK